MQKEGSVFLGLAGALGPGQFGMGVWWCLAPFLPEPLGGLLAREQQTWICFGVRHLGSLLYLKQMWFSEAGPQWWGHCSEESRNLWDLGGVGRLSWICFQKQVCLVPFGAHLELVSGLMCGCRGLLG